MRTVIKWAGIVLAGILGVVLVAALVGFVSSESRISRTYDIEKQGIAVPTDFTEIEEGRRLVAIRGCADCHGADLGGEILIDDPALGTIYSTNLTSGAGSAVEGYTAEDWERAIRHGVTRDGRSLYAMPTVDYAMLSDEDLGRMIAHLQSLPPVDREPVPHRLGLVGRGLFVAGQLPLLSAELVDHAAVAPGSVVPAVNVEFGQYVATTCTGCHGPSLAGGSIPGSAPDDPAAANLTPSGNLGNWTFEEFQTALGSGLTPEGKQLDPAVMPWPITAQMTPVELEALWVYLQSLEPAVAAN